jgi:zinc transport system ATP-binding protein
MVEVNNISFSYNNIKPYLIDELSFNIQSGSYVSVIGENGSAKTTLIKLMLGILKPQKGYINTTSNSIGYVPQKLDNFNSQFPITVYEILNTHRKALKIKDKNSILDALKSVNMLDFKNTLIGNLSGGQQQKVFIARALLGNSDILILDEPSTGVDNRSMKEIYDIIIHLNKTHNITVVSIEHNMDAALQNSSHILKMRNGSGSLYTIDEFLSKGKTS